MVALLAIGAGLLWLVPADFFSAARAGFGRWSVRTGRGCEDVGTQYARAIRSLGTSSATSNGSSFREAGEGCRAVAGTIPSTSRASACRASVSYYVTAYDRRAAIAGATGRPSGSGMIGVSAAGIVGADDGVGEIEELARTTMADCVG